MRYNIYIWHHGYELMNGIHATLTEEEKKTSSLGWWPRAFLVYNDSLTWRRNFISLVYPRIVTFSLSPNPKKLWFWQSRAQSARRHDVITVRHIVNINIYSYMPKYPPKMPIILTLSTITLSLNIYYNYYITLFKKMCRRVDVVLWKVVRSVVIRASARENSASTIKESFESLLLLEMYALFRYSCKRWRRLHAVCGCIKCRGMCFGSCRNSEVVTVTAEVYDVACLPNFLFTVAAIACGACCTGEPKILAKYGESLHYVGFKIHLSRMRMFCAWPIFDNLLISLCKICSWRWWDMSKICYRS